MPLSRRPQSCAVVVSGVVRTVMLVMPFSSSPSDMKKKDKNIKTVDNCLPLETTNSSDPEFDLRDMWDTWDGQFEFVGNSYRSDVADRCDLLKLPKIARNHHHTPPVYTSFADAPKVQVLQKQMNALADNQHLTDERYARTKEENAALQARVHMLEEQLRDTELRCEERLASEERRHRELVTRVDREKQLHIDNCAIRLQSIEAANESLRLEADKCKSALETARNEKTLLEQRVNDLNVGTQSFKDEIHLLEAEIRKLKQKEKDNEEIIKGLTRELEISRLEKDAMVTELRSPSPYVTELTAQLESLKHQNRSLKDSYDELQASNIAKGIEQGRLLLTETPSLASELDGLTHADHSPPSLQINKMKTALKDQQEVNDQLRAYIDNILLNIVENHPELLEVKQNL